MNKIAFVLSILAICSISGCVKATHEYDDYVSYHNSLGGNIEDFARGYSAGAQGDPFGAALEISDEGQRLQEAKSTWHFWAWVFSVLAILASLVAGGAKPSQK